MYLLFYPWVLVKACCACLPVAQIVASSIQLLLDDPVLLNHACMPEPKPHYKLNILKAYRVLELRTNYQCRQHTFAHCTRLFISTN